MTFGINSTVRSLQTRLLLRWVPKWYGAFSDPQGGFYERLGKGFKPVFTGQRRLVTQCRQLSIYSHASLLKNKQLYKNLEAKFEYICGRYHDPETGLWHFALEDSGAVADRTCDLYALSFVIFACSHYSAATGDARAANTAREVLDLVDKRFRLQGLPGLAEALDVRGRPLPQVRRQNPHMHLLEACLFAYETWNDPAYAAMADEMVALFYGYFYKAGKQGLCEFFTDDLRPHPERGERLEPGHYFEWIWLLKRHGAMTGEDSRHDAVASELLDWANRYGWDAEYGGIYDIVAQNGHVLAATKRIWPFCEALKANALMLDSAPDRQALKDRMSSMVSVFNRKYMLERGFWTEWLNRDLTPAADYMPGTTPYHVYFGIAETMDILNRRGQTFSYRALAFEIVYGLRRALSSVVRRVRGFAGGG